MAMVNPNQKPKFQANKHYQKKLLVFFTITILLLAATLWILSIERVISGPWPAILSVVFTTFGILIAFLQWVTPSQGRVYLLASLFDKDWEIKLTKRKGALLVWTQKQLGGVAIYLHRGFNAESAPINVAANVIERNTHGTPYFVALFPSLDPGNYTVSASEMNYCTNITINAGRLTEIDWRYNHSKSMHRGWAQLTLLGGKKP